jgi:hypothetical protein
MPYNLLVASWASPGDQQTFMQSWCRVALKDAEEDQIRTWVGKGPGELARNSAADAIQPV